MKKLLCLAFFGLLLMMTTNIASAGNEPVPDSTRLSDLPPRSKVLFQTVPNFEYERDNKGYRASWGRGAVNLFITKREDFPRMGDTISIKGFDDRLGFDIETDSWGHLYASGVKTVGEFNDEVKGQVTIVTDTPLPDPYAGLDDEIKQDLLMTKILAAIKADQYSKALPIFAYMEKQGKAQPESFYYYYIVALDKTDRSEAAKARAKTFLQTYGKKSKFYADVLAVLAK